MLVVRVELWSAITGKKTEIGRMYVANDGTSTNHKRGNYDVKVARRGSTKYEGWDKLKPVRTGRVEDWPRQSYSVWRLVAKALKSAFPEA